MLNITLIFLSLIKKGPPTSLQILSEASNPITLQQYASYSLYCNANGVPTPEVYWMHSNSGKISRIISAGMGARELVLTNLKLRDTGTYLCLAINKHGELRRNLTIIVAGFYYFCT